MEGTVLAVPRATRQTIAVRSWHCVSIALLSIVGCSHEQTLGSADDAGGDTAVDDTTADGTSDGASPDAEVIVDPQWRSYDMVVSKVTRSFTKPVPAIDSTDWRGRVDLREAAATPVVVMTPEYGTPVALSRKGRTWSATELPVRIVTPTPFGSLEDRWTTFEVVGDAKPASAMARGISIVTTGDGSVEGTLEGTVTLETDRSPPFWRAFAESAFAEVPLPWDARAFLASEPYEGMASPSYVFPVGTSMLALDRRRSSAWGVTRELGVDVRGRDWDAIVDLAAVGVDLPDLMGNHLDGAPHFKFGGAKVAARSAKTWLPTTTDGVFVWGAAVASSCGGTSCLVMGPFAWDACSRGSEGGVALRLPGFGTATITVDVIGRSTAAPPLAAPFFAEVAEPGIAAVPMVIAAPTWKIRGDGSFDASWSVVAPKTGGTETGVAVSAGGVGVKRAQSCASTPRYELTIRVSRIDLGG